MLWAQLLARIYEALGPEFLQFAPSNTSVAELVDACCCTRRDEPEGCSGGP